MSPKFSSRAAAFHVDALIITVIFEFFHLQWLAANTDSVSGIGLLGLYCMVTFLYSVIPTKLFGQTLGKKLYGLQVLSAGNEPELSWGAVVQREVVFKTISALCFGIGFWRARHTEEAKAWHDDQCRTKVVALPSALGSSGKVVFEFFVSVMTVVAGVALTLWAMFMSALPLPIFQRQLAAAGVQVESLQGSLGEGLRFQKLSYGEGDTEKIEVGALFISVNSRLSWQTGRVVFKELSFHDVRIPFPGKFSWPPVLEHIASTLTSPDAAELRIEIQEATVKNLTVVNEDKTLRQVDDIQLKEFKVEDSEITIQSFVSRAKGLELDLKNVRFTDGVVHFTDLRGKVLSSFVPFLLKPLDFEAKGKFAVGGAQVLETDFSGRFYQGLGTFSKKGEVLKVSGKKLKVSELFKTELLFNQLDFNLESRGQTRYELLDKLTASYHVRMCDRQFIAKGDGAVWAGSASNSASSDGSLAQDSSVRLHLRSKNLQKFADGEFAVDDVLEDYIQVLLGKSSDQLKAMERDSMAEFCHSYKF